MGKKAMPFRSRALVLASTFLWTVGNAGASFLVPQADLPGNCIPQFAVPMPVFGHPNSIARVNTLGHRKITATMKEIEQAVLPLGATDTCGMGVTFGKTRVWAFEFSDTVTGKLLALANWPAATIQARRNVPTTVTYVNNLPPFDFSNTSGPPFETGLVQGLMTVDQTLHWADPYLLGCAALDCTIPANASNPCCQPYTQSPPAVVHLHGGEVASSFDGVPEAWFTPDGKKGPSYGTLDTPGPGKAIYYYPNAQEPGTLWFHDHTLGATRTNVYSGLAGFYFLQDPATEPRGLPKDGYEIEMAIQNRHFDTNSQLFFDNSQNPIPPLPPPTGPGVQLYQDNCQLCHGPLASSTKRGRSATQIQNAISTVPAMSSRPNLTALTATQIQDIANALAVQVGHPFFGNGDFNDDVTLVNGAPWPFLDVQPRRYRFHLLDGDNMLSYTLGFGSVPAYVIGADDNFLDAPVPITGQTVSLLPGERFDVIVDFSNFAGQTVYMTNSTDNIVEFRVGAAKSLKVKDDSCNPARGQCKRPKPMVRLTDGNGNLAPGVKIDKVRRLVLNAPFTDVDFLLNNTYWDGAMSPGIAADFTSDGISELPQQGATELWEIIGLTTFHPIHTHLVQFQILNRQNADLFGPAGYKATWDRQFPAATSFNPVCTGGVFCPGYGPPLDYNTPIADPNDPVLVAIGKDAIGGNPPIGSFLQGDPQPPRPEESGWKDTAQITTAVTRLVVRWTPTDKPVVNNTSYAGRNLFPFDPTDGPGYAWHCHIITHEDNEMMRPYKVTK